MPGTSPHPVRHFGLAVGLAALVAGLAAPDGSAQVGYGKRPPVPTRPDTARQATPVSTPVRPDSAAAGPDSVAARPGISFPDTASGGPVVPDSLGISPRGDAPWPADDAAAGRRTGEAPGRPQLPYGAYPVPAVEFTGPPEESHLTGPPVPAFRDQTDTSGRGRFGILGFTPDDDREAQVRRLGRFPGDPEVPQRYLLPVRDGRLVRDIDLDLGRRTIQETTRFENVVVKERLPRDIADYAYVQTYSGRWRDAVKETRPLIGREVDPAYLGGQGVTFESPVSLGPAENILGRGASITIRGQERITIAGTSRWDANPSLRETQRQSKFPQLDLRQDLNVKVDGKVGDKVSIDWVENTQAETPLANRIAIRYTGYDDEVMKSVELGNTNLSLPGTQFVSYNGQHQGLFGIKTVSQFGDVGVSVIASKQEGQTASNRFVGYARETQRRIFDVDYVQRRFFFLIDPVDPFLTGVLVPPSDPNWIPPPVIDSLQVWRDDRDQTNNNGAPGAAYLDPRLGAPAARDSVPAYFDPLTEQEDFTIREDLFTIVVRLPNGREERYVYPVLDILSPIGSQEVLAATFRATYTLPSGETRVVRYGALVNGVVTAKAIYIPDGEYEQFEGEFYSRNDYWYPMRRLELRNIYSLGASNIDFESIKLSVKRSIGEDPVRFPGGASTDTYMRGLGIDRENISGQPVPDDLVDRAFVFSSLGVIILPDLRPFSPAAEDSVWPFFRADLLSTPPVRPRYFVGEDANRAVYDKRGANQGEDGKYFFDLVYATPQTQFVLSAPGTILEGSEVVVVDGQTLQRGSDYTIDYETGIVNLTGQTQLPENAQVAIDYAYAPLFALGQKTLMGFSTTWDPGVKRRTFGTTWLFESAGVAERRPKLGEEPSRTIVGDLNGGFQSQPLLFNRLVESLPGVRARSDSRFDLSAELGLSIPNPNTRGNAYLDDFEGAKDNSILSLIREDWMWSAVPDSIYANHYLGGDMRSRRGGLIWYNPVTSPVRERDLFPDLDPQEGDDRKSVLSIQVDPKVASDTLGVIPAKETWVGLTQGLSASGTDFTRKQYIEIWINDFRDPELRESDPVMHIDLGIMSEDAEWSDKELPNGVRDSEDANQDGILDRPNDLSCGLADGQSCFEDTGFDSLLSKDEPSFNARTNPDPNLDDFDLDRDPAEDNPNDPAFYALVNRLEENSHLDDEDVNRDAAFQTESSNNYYTFAVHLADTLFVAADIYADYGVADSPDNGPNGWRLFRIPIEVGQPVNAPSLASVRHLRIWFSGLPAKKLLQIASIDVLGNLYKDEPLRDAAGNTVEPLPGEVVKMRAINNKEDANEYVPPFPLEERSGVVEREQSIALDYLNLEPGHEGAAYRAAANDRDVTLYETLRWYVYGGRNPFTGDPASGVEAFVRLGTDTLNYYEVAVPVVLGWTEQKVTISDLSQLKVGEAGADSCMVAGQLLPCGELRDGDGRLLRFVGRPSLTRLRRLVFGVRNVADVPQSGSVWFDDIRSDDVIRDLGTASRVEINAGFADLLTINGSMLRRDEDFLSIGSGGQRTGTRGSGSQQRDYAIRSTINLHKFFETSGVSLPFAFNFLETTELPEFRAGDDVILTPEQSASQSRGQTQRGYSVNYTRRGVQRGVLYYTLDALRADFSLSDRRGLSQTRRDSSRTINLGLAYNVSPTLKPLRWGKSEIRYFPDNVSLGARLGSNRVFTFDRDLDNPGDNPLVAATFQKDANLNGATSITPLRSLRTSYRIDSRRDLTYDNPAPWLGGINIGWETLRSQNLDASWNPPVLRRLAPTFSFRGGSRDDHSPNLQLAGSPEQVRNLASVQTLSAGFSVPLSMISGQGVPAKPDSLLGPVGRFQRLVGRVGKFRDIRSTLAINNSHDFTYAYGVPNWKYQLGLSIDPGPDVVLSNRGRETLGRSRSASFGSGYDFNAGITVNVSYAWATREQEQTATTPRAGRTVTWPQMDLSWRSFQTRIPQLAQIFRTLNLESRYTRDVSENGPVSYRSLSVTERRDWNPIVGVNGTVGKGWTMRARVTSTGSEDQDNEAGLGRFTRSTRRQIQLNISKRFDPTTGLKFPWQDKPINLKSDLVLSTDVNYSTDRSESGRTGQPAVVNRDGTTTSIRSGLSYKFRRNIDGDLSVNLGRNNNNKTGNKLRTISLSASIVFNF